MHDRNLAQLTFSFSFLVEIMIDFEEIVAILCAHMLIAGLSTDPREQSLNLIPLIST